MGWTPSLAGARGLARPAEDAHPIQKHGGRMLSVFGKGNTQAGMPAVLGGSG